MLAKLFNHIPLELINHIQCGSFKDKIYTFLLRVKVIKVLQNTTHKYFTIFKKVLLQLQFCCSTNLNIVITFKQ